MDSSDCLANRSALGYFSTATLHVLFGLSRNRADLECFSVDTLDVQMGLYHQQSSPGFFSTASGHVQFGLSRQQISSRIFFHGYAVCIVRTVSPTEQLWDVFPRLRCLYSSGHLTNRTALGCVSTDTLHVKFGLSRQQNSSTM